MKSNTGTKYGDKETFPELLVIQSHLDHRQTLIILHGRGSTASKFAPPLLATKTPSGETLETAFPHAKIIFPTASRNRATIYKRSYTHQWFDNWHLEDYEQRQDLQREGLKKSVLYVHALLRDEIKLVGKENVVLWGLSQGCATSLAALLTWYDESFAAVVGMCGWLPFAGLMRDIAQEDGSDPSDDPFGDEGEDVFPHSCDDDYAERETDANISRSDQPDPAAQAVMFFREEIEMEASTAMKHLEVPIFLGHGTEDEKVAIQLGVDARAVLDLLGVNVQMVEYNDLGHWYSPEMLDDIFQFLREKLHKGETVD